MCTDVRALWPIRSKRHSSGQSLVEFALVIPIFLLVVFGLIDMGRLVYINNSLAEGAREAARWGSVQARSQTAAGLTSIEIHATDVLVAVPDPIATTACQDYPTGGRSCDILTVQVSSPVTMLTPIVAQLVGPRTYQATSTVTVNQ